ncbi:hypothetical protein PG987_001032 [Apiospora arundinis]
MYAVSAAIGQVKWDWFRAQSQPLRHLELLDEASHDPLGPLPMLFAGTGRSLVTLGALIALLELAVAPEAALPIAIQALGLAFLRAVIVTSNNAPLWKGSVLALLYHGLEHTPAGDDTVTGSGMADAAKNIRAVLVRSSKTKTFLLGY